MNLLPYQILLLNEEYARNNEDLKSIVESVNANLAGKNIHEDNEIYDDQSHKVISNLDIRNRDIYYILNSASIINDYNCSQVSVGATFTVVFMDGEMEEETFTLIEEKVTTESILDGFVTLNSDFGAAVHRKKANETFVYKLQNGALVSGIVTKIFTKEEQNEYFKDKIKTNIKK